MEIGMNFMISFWSVFDALATFLPLLGASLIVAALLSIPVKTEFKDGDGPNQPLFIRAFGYLAMFSIFGMAVAYFMSQGLTEADSGNRFSNPTLDPFAAALISLITGGLAFVAKMSPMAPKALPAGVLCFLLNAMLGYETLIVLTLQRL